MADPINQAEAPNLLEQVARCSGHDGGEECLLVVERGQYHAVDLRMRRANLSADLDPAAIGQARIEQGDVWSRGRNASQRLSGISGLPNNLDVISGIEQVREATPHQLMIIED